MKTQKTCKHSYLLVTYYTTTIQYHRSPTTFIPPGSVYVTVIYTRIP